MEAAEALDLLASRIPRETADAMMETAVYTAVSSGHSFSVVTDCPAGEVSVRYSLAGGYQVTLPQLQLQREFEAGDPHGNVRREAERIIAEMKADGKWEE